MLPTPPLGGLMWGGKSGFLKAGEGAAGNWGPPRVLPLHRVWGAQLHIELRVQLRPRVRQPRPPLSRRETAGLRGGLPRRIPSRAQLLAAATGARRLENWRLSVEPGDLATRATLATCAPVPRSPRGTPRSPPAPALPWPSSAASTRLSALYRAAHPGAAPSELIVAVVTLPIASPGPAPAAPCPGPPPAALRLPRLLLRWSGQLFSGCSRGPADPAPGPAHFGSAHYTLRIRPPPAPPAAGWKEDARAARRPRGALAWGPREGTRRLGDLESSPPAADPPPLSFLPPRSHVLQDGSAQVPATQDGAGPLRSGSCHLPRSPRGLEVVGPPRATSGRLLQRAGDIWNSKSRAAVEELSRRTIGSSGMCTDVCQYVCSACPARGKAPANRTVFRSWPGASG